MTLPAWLTPFLDWFKTAALASVGFIEAEAAAYLHLATIGLILRTVVVAIVLGLIAVKVGSTEAVIAAPVLYFLYGLLVAHMGVASSTTA